MNKPLILLAILAAGCTPTPPPPKEQMPGPAQVDGTITVTPVQASDDPTPNVPLMAKLHVWQIEVPFGSVSQREEFWKHVVEQSVDPGTYEMLYKNGIRVGQSNVNEWDYFKRLLEQNPARSKFQAADGKTSEIVTKPDVPEQRIFAWNPAGELEGRTYDRCTNSLVFSFAPVAHKFGSVRVAVCPKVVTARKRFVPVGDVTVTEFDYVSPERWYDQKLEAEIPLDHFLIIAPSPEARRDGSLGRTFLVTDNEPERTELVLLLVPKLYRVSKDMSKAPPAKP